MRKRLSPCSKGLVVACLTALAASAQFRGFQAAAVVPPAPVAVEPGSEVEAPLTLRIRSGYHINSDQPAEDYLIPTQIVWDAAPLEVVRVGKVCENCLHHDAGVSTLRTLHVTLILRADGAAHH